ncbi:hypothetical protein EVAR_55925_1 [Eumeta japonica]|uniref:Uncharacterized protein n=1 Tax=Eumeta variegata TaxID=151549 RepID=A0A4C1Z0G9_EUMVA|nr:hypothetical protein EVAR_55925_1 [Eumeta japonica]
MNKIIAGDGLEAKNSVSKSPVSGFERTLSKSPGNALVTLRGAGCGWESLMKNVTLGNVTMSHRTRERPAECLASLSHSTMIGLPRAQH